MLKIQISRTCIKWNLPAKETSKSDLGPIQRPIQWVPGFLPGSEVDHSRPSSAVVKSEWSYAYVPLHAFVAWTEATLSSHLLGDTNVVVVS